MKSSLMPCWRHLCLIICIVRLAELIESFCKVCRHPVWAFLFGRFWMGKKVDQEVKKKNIHMPSCNLSGGSIWWQQLQLNITFAMHSYLWVLLLRAWASNQWLKFTQTNRLYLQTWFIIPLCKVITTLPRWPDAFMSEHPRWDNSLLHSANWQA